MQGRLLFTTLTSCLIFTLSALAEGNDYQLSVVNFQYELAAYNKNKRFWDGYEGADEVVIHAIAEGKDNIIRVEKFLSDDELSVKFVGGKKSHTLSSDKYYFSRQRISKDKSAVFFSVGIKEIPPEWTDEIIISGNLIIVIAHNSGYDSVKNVKLEKGQQFTIGTADIEIDDASMRGVDFSVSFKSTDRYLDLYDINFIGRDRKPVKYQESSQSRKGHGKTSVVRKRFRFNKKHDVLTVNAKHWKDSSSKSIPFTFSLAKPF